MHLVHGTWLPDEGEEFVQRGGFYLWVEADTEVDGALRGKRASFHPRALGDRALVTYLGEKLGLTDLPVGNFAQTLSPIYLQLPTANGKPLPSFELQPYVDSEIPDEFALAGWQIPAYRLPNLVAALNSIHFVALHAASEFQLGADLLFWHQLTRVIRQIIAKDQYIPALRHHQLGQPTDTRTKGASDFEIRAGWEILSDAYEAAVPPYAAAMPIVCRAGSLAAPMGTLYDPENLIRHFSENVLARTVTGTPLTAKHETQIAGSLLYDCFHPTEALARKVGSEALDEYRQWATWRAKLTATRREAGFTLGFRLDEPPPATSSDAWPVSFLIAPRTDPSLKLSLADYWRFDRGRRDALTPRFGPDVEKHVLLALGHAARVYPKVWDGLQTAEPAGFTLTLAEVYEFLHESAWILEDAGYTVMVPSWWTPAGRRRAKVRLKGSPRGAKPTAARTGGYFSIEGLASYQPQLMIGDQVVDEAEWERLLAAKTPLVQFRGQWMELDRARMEQLLEFWKKHRATGLELSVPDLLRMAAESDGDLDWDHDAALREIFDRLENKSAFAPIEDLPALYGTLRDYQKRGVAWLGYLEQLGLNPCLADDMGLGKTLEVIAHLVRERGSGETIPPTLVIAPTSVLSNWRKEIERFAPGLRALIHHGPERPKNADTFRAAYAACDVVISSFALARLDEQLLRGVEWRRVVVDEAQNIKNPEAAQTRALGKLTAQHRLALTGTPVENRLLDLWSIFNFLNPGYLGKQAQFRKSFELPILKQDDPTRLTTLKKLVEPLILRRVKTDRQIIADLPDKIEQKLFCNLTPEQASLYAAVVKDVEEQLAEAEGIQRRGLILATLTKLKQICNHPAQFLQDGSAFAAERSHKLTRLAEMVEEAMESGDSLLVFTQFAEMGAAIEEQLARTLHCPTYYLHGATSLARREKMIAAFQDPDADPAVFVLSLRAGGVGLNLTRANHVFHFDRWWNPAVEDQATDRAFRIGQRKNVFVHKFVAVGTLEERIDQMIEDKKRVASSIVGSDESWLTELDNETFKDLIALRRGAVLE
jgi:SNF2 family DNA or RNA helicase